MSRERESRRWETFDESWQQGFCNEVVSLPESFLADGNRIGIGNGVTPPEIYLNGNGWIELHFRLVGERDADYVVIINRLDPHDGRGQAAAAANI